jgi:hypothetical protein
MKIRYGLLIYFVLQFMAFEGSSQSRTVRLWNKIFNDTSSVENPKSLAYPILAYAPETSWKIGVSGVLVYYANRDTTNRLSEASGQTFVTLEGQYGLLFDHALYSDQNKWFALGKFNVQSYPISVLRQ